MTDIVLGIISFMLTAIGFFTAGFHFCRWQTLERLRKKWRSQYTGMEVLNLIANEKETIR